MSPGIGIILGWLILTNGSRGSGHESSFENQLAVALGKRLLHLYGQSSFVRELTLSLDTLTNAEDRDADLHSTPALVHCASPGNLP